jgi:hypothetical protein
MLEILVNRCKYEEAADKHMQVMVCQGNPGAAPSPRKSRDLPGRFGLDRLAKTGGSAIGQRAASNRCWSDQATGSMSGQAGTFAAHLPPSDFVHSWEATGVATSPHSSAM